MAVADADKMKNTTLGSIVVQPQSRQRPKCSYNAFFSACSEILWLQINLLMLRWCIDVKKWTKTQFLTISELGRILTLKLGWTNSINGVNGGRRYGCVFQ